MSSNIDKYRDDLAKLVKLGNKMILALQRYCDKEKFDSNMSKTYGKKAEALIKELPSFTSGYQSWYSEAKVLVRQLLPDRLADFSSFYERPKTRREIDYGNYCIEDALHGLTLTRGIQKEKVVGPEAAISKLAQQVAIVESIVPRFESSLFDIRTLVQADIFDSELDAAEELLANKFARAAGALGGVVLERHLGQVCSNHSIKVTKKNPTISDFNDLLKSSGLIDVAVWRFIQHLGDIRNECDHSKGVNPSSERVKDLLEGVAKISKTVY